jgi:dTDP-4-amino-4,6-dideoxygalactose transaminase
MAADMLTLPSHPWMAPDEVDAVADAVIDFYRG